MTARQPLAPPSYDATSLANRIARQWDGDIVPMTIAALP
jgi:hypothetical protein